MIDEVDGATTEYRFSDQKEDVAIADGRFHFTPPAGVETIEGELGPRGVSFGTSWQAAMHYPLRLLR